MPSFDPKMSKHVDFCIKDSDVNKVIVYDDELKIKSMEQYLFKLQSALWKIMIWLIINH